MRRCVICAVIAALLSGGPTASRALTDSQLLKIAEAVFATNDSAVQAAYTALRKAHCLDADGIDGDPRQLITFHVLEANDAQVSAAFKLLIDRKVIGGTAAPAPELSAADLATLERVRQAIADCRREQAGLGAKFSRLTQFGWVRERAELPGLISAQLDTMGNFYMEAARLFKPLAGRQDAAVVAVGVDVQRCQREMESWYDRYNSWASSN
jgi:hypothetical protein